ncbi:MliC family protein [Rhodovibrio sodomensis]|nr:MliC family protein [Rhodovibrio sodomensis]
MLHRTWIAVALAALLAGCAGTPKTTESKPGRTLAYACEDGSHLEVLVTEADTVKLIPPGRSAVRLNRVATASGARYTGAGLSFWDSGDEATFTPAGGAAVDCELRPDGSAPWAAAAARGAEFRAAGQEPGWHAEVAHGRIEATLDYGARIVTAPVVQSETGTGATRWRGTARPGDLRLRARDIPCTDSMNGWAYPATVLLTIDGETFEGCGRWLQSR